MGVEERLRRHAGAGCRRPAAYRSGSESRDQAAADSGREARTAFWMESVQAREVERDLICARWADGGRRCRADEPRRLVQNRRDEGAAAAEGDRRGFRRVLPVSRRRGRDREGGSNGDHPAGRISARSGGDRSGGPAWDGNDLYGSPAFPALSFVWMTGRLLS